MSRTSKVTGDVESYTYDSQNRLVGYASPTTSARYAYDALSRRLAKTVDGVANAFVYDVSNENDLAHDDVLLEFDFSGPAVLMRRWVHSGNADEPIAFEDYSVSSGGGAGQRRAVFADRQGSVIWVTEPESGMVLAAYTYDGFGAIEQTAGGLTQRYGFSGREYDLETGTYFYRARSYDPHTGTFLQSDPIGFNGGDRNLYAYVANNPFNWDDPTGLSMSATEKRILTGAGMMGVARVLTSVLSLAANIAAMMDALDVDSPADYPGYGNNSDRDPDGDKCEAAKASVGASKRLPSACSIGLSPAENLRRLHNAIEKAAARAQRDSLCKDGPKGRATYGGEQEAHENAWINVGTCMVVTGRSVFYP